MKNKLVKCRACGAEIAKDAKACPSCGAKNKSKHPVIGVLFVILGLSLLASVFGGNNSVPQKVGESNSPEQASPSEITPKQTSFAIGEKVDLNHIIVTMTDVSKSNGSDFNKPADGNVFVVCSFEIDNNSDKDIAVSSIMSFEAYVDDYSTTMSLAATITSEKSQLDGSVAAGKKMSGVIGYEIPSNWKNLEISFTPDFWSGGDIKFVATP